MTLRVPLIVSRPPGRIPQQPASVANLNVTTLSTIAASYYFLNDTGARPKARFVRQPDQPNGMIQRLTFVAPTMPKNNHNWPNPFPRKPIPQLWNTSQGQNPELIPEAQAATPTVHMHVVSPGAMGRMMGRS